MYRLSVQMTGFFDELEEVHRVASEILRVWDELNLGDYPRPDLEIEIREIWDVTDPEKPEKMRRQYEHENVRNPSIRWKH